MGSELDIDRRDGRMCIILALRGAWVLRQRYIYFSTLRACMVFVVVNTTSHNLANFPLGLFITSLSDIFSRTSPQVCRTQAQLIQRTYMFSALLQSKRQASNCDQHFSSLRVLIS